MTKFGESYSERVIVKPLRVGHGWDDSGGFGEKEALRIRVIKILHTSR